MGLLIGQGSPLVNLEQTWPLDARMALFLLETQGDAVSGDRPRQLDRIGCKARARLMRVSSGRPEMVELFVRDLSAEHIGFICSQPLVIGDEYECELSHISARLSCVIGRCREFSAGWYEGVLGLRQANEQAAESEWRVAV